MRKFSFKMQSKSVGLTEIWPTLRARRVLADSYELEYRMAELCRQLPNGWPVGLELKLSDPLEYARIAAGDSTFLAGILSSDRGAVNDPKYGKIASELVLHRVWGFRSGSQKDIRWTTGELARLIGEGDQTRSTRCMATNAELLLQIEYETPSAIPRRLRMLEKTIQSGSDLSPIYFAVGVMMEFLVIHPYMDGNGRVARALFQLVLAARLNLPTPVFPLLPLMIYMRRQLYAAYLAWELRGDCSLVCDLIVQWLWLLVEYCWCSVDMRT